MKLNATEQEIWYGRLEREFDLQFRTKNWVQGPCKASLFSERFCDVGT